jgi:hypothetical protein
LRAQLARRLTAGLAVALISLTACSANPPSQAALKDKLKTEAAFKSLSDKQVDCIAGVLIKYAKAGDLKDYVDGKKAVEDVRGPKDKEKAVEDETKTCVTAK